MSLVLKLIWAWQVNSYLSLNLINYKLYSERYIIKEKNGIVKEYYGFNDILIYEGEYLNGQRNGKGKEYHLFKGNLIFEGEYKNGKKMEKENNIMIMVI